MRSSFSYRLLLATFLGWMLIFSLDARAAQRFPPPDFESGHSLPETTVPAARAVALEYLDIAVLAVALSVASWIIFRKRSRKAMIGLSVFSLLYFGFWKQGCVCAIGSVQNVALALAGNGYSLPVSVLAFFALPLGVALFFGRAFCAGVCPHGALQDLVLRKPVKVPAWLEHGLGVLPFVYLGAAVLFAATGSAFLICQYDPFVPVFRMSGRWLMVAAGVALLVLGVFVGRPYCRFLCPLGALLKISATVSRLHVRVTPATCTQCRLCEHSCPFGAMRNPETPDPRALQKDRRTLTALLAAAPVIILASAWVGWTFSDVAARMHPTVSLSERVVREKGTPTPTGVLSPDDLALERARQAPDKLLNEAVQIRDKFRIGSSMFGAWVGLVIAVKLISLCRRRIRKDFEPDQGSCVACARCFETCPDEWIRRGLTPPSWQAPESEQAGGRSSQETQNSSERGHPVAEPPKRRESL